MFRLGVQQELVGCAVYTVQQVWRNLPKTSLPTFLPLIQFNYFNR